MNSKDFGSLSQPEKEAKINETNLLLMKYGFESTKIKVINQKVINLTTGDIDTKEIFMLEEKVSLDKAENLKVFL
jgi:hypothetical protein